MANLHDQPLNEDEKIILLNAGWKFLNENYIYIPDDYDGCMADGIRSIRRILESIQARLIMVKPLLAEPSAPSGAVAGEVTHPNKMTPLDKLKQWAKTLNFDPSWQTKVDAQVSIQDLEDMVCDLTAEIGCLNLQYLSQLM